MLQDKIKGWCGKQPKSNYKIFINTLFEDINNDPSLIPIKEINFNCIWECCHFNALVNPILTNKELKNKHKDKIKEVNQEMNHLKDV